LSHLDRFPVDIVKIDKSFIDSLAGPDATPSPLVDAIVRLGAVLDVEVTAEGIESGDQLARLRVLGCGHGQGYFFARPVAEGDLREMLTSGALQPTAPV
jgi:EAL domain-containing protein (putative c-di-GMP-specific phosphodiesterase class I)